VNALVDFRAQPRNLTLGDAGHPHRFDKLINRSRRDALHVRLLDHRRERLLRGAPRFEKPREVAPLPQLGDLQIDRAGARLPAAIAIAVAGVLALDAALAVARAAAPFNVGFHQPLRDELQQLAQHVDVGPCSASSASAILTLVIVSFLGWSFGNKNNLRRGDTMAATLSQVSDLSRTPLPGTRSTRGLS
jgi:hypothetical protein